MLAVSDHRYHALTLLYIPGFLNEPLSVFLQLFLLKANNDTEQLVLQSFKSHSVVDDHGATKHSRSILWIGQLGVQVESASVRVTFVKLCNLWVSFSLLHYYYYPGTLSQFMQFLRTYAI